MTEVLDKPMEYDGFGSHGTIDHEDYPFLKGMVHVEPKKRERYFVSFGDNGRVTFSGDLINDLGDIEGKDVCVFLHWTRESRLQTKMLNGESVEYQQKFNVKKELNFIWWSDEQIKTATTKLDKKIHSRKLKKLKNTDSMYISIKDFLKQYNLENLMKNKVRFQKNGVQIIDGDENRIVVDLLSRGKNKVENV